MIATPESGVKLSNEIDAYALNYLAEHNMLRESEDVLAYYDYTMMMTGTEAAILTDERVMYHKEGRTTAVELTEIEDIQFRNEGMTGDIIEVKTTSAKRLKIEIAPLNGGQSFHNALIDAWETAQQ